MSEKIEVNINPLTALLGALGGLIATSWSIAPLITSGKISAIITQNQMLLVLAGLTTLIIPVIMSTEIQDRDVSFSKVGLYSALVSFLIVGTLGYSALPVTTAIGQSGGEITGDNLKEASLKVEGMVCQGCKRTVKGYLESMSGVKKVEITLSEKKARVIYDSDKISSQEIVEAKVFEGVYTATLLREGGYAQT